MSRFLGYAKKLNYRISRLEQAGGLGSVSEAMRIYAQTGELPLNPRLRKQVLMMKEMACLMAATVPKRGPSEPQEEIVQDRPLSETFESVETPEWIVEGGGNVSIRRFV
jgi:hypothetical protein